MRIGNSYPDFYNQEIIHLVKLGEVYVSKEEIFRFDLSETKKVENSFTDVYSKTGKIIGEKGGLIDLLA